jgi:hypothetical protein
MALCENAGLRVRNTRNHMLFTRSDGMYVRNECTMCEQIHARKFMRTDDKHTQAAQKCQKQQSTLCCICHIAVMQSAASRRIPAAAAPRAAWLGLAAFAAPMFGTDAAIARAVATCCRHRRPRAVLPQHLGGGGGGSPCERRDCTSSAAWRGRHR